MTNKDKPAFEETVKRLAARRDGQRAWLERQAPEVFYDQKHISEGTEERKYWHYGYMVALTDVLGVLEHGSTTADLTAAESDARRWKDAADANSEAAMGYQDRALDAERKLAAARDRVARLEGAIRGVALDLEGCRDVLAHPANGIQQDREVRRIEERLMELAVKLTTAMDAGSCPNSGLLTDRT